MLHTIPGYIPIPFCIPHTLPGYEGMGMGYSTRAPPDTKMAAQRRLQHCSQCGVLENASRNERAHHWSPGHNWGAYMEHPS